MVENQLVSERTVRVMRDALVWDNHGCLPLRPDDERFVPQLERYRAAGVHVVGINVAWDGMPPDTGPRMLAQLRRWLDQRPDDYLMIRHADDVLEAKRTGRLGVLFDIEGGAALREQLSMVQLYYDLGVRWMSIAYNKPNALGGGCLEADDGLTEFGAAVVAEMNRVGMVPCCSHTGARTARDVLALSTGPVIFSHSNARAVWDHPRNIDDDLIRSCARTGGVVCLNGIGLFLGPEPTASVPAFLRHAAHMLDLVGPEHVGIGLDYVFDLGEITEIRQDDPGFLPASAGFTDDISMLRMEDLSRLAEGLLDLGSTDAEVTAVLGGNLLRVARQAWR